MGLIYDYVYPEAYRKYGTHKAEVLHGMLITARVIAFLDQLQLLQGQPDVEYIATVHM